MKYTYYRIDPLTNRLFVAGIVYADKFYEGLAHLKKAYPNERILMDIEPCNDTKNPPQNHFELDQLTIL